MFDEDGFLGGGLCLMNIVYDNLFFEVFDCFFNEGLLCDFFVYDVVWFVVDLSCDNYLEYVIVF